MAQSPNNNNPRSFFKEKVGGLSSISDSTEWSFFLLIGVRHYPWASTIGDPAETAGQSENNPNRRFKPVNVGGCSARTLITFSGWVHGGIHARLRTRRHDGLPYPRDSQRMPEDEETSGPSDNTLFQTDARDPGQSHLRLMSAANVTDPCRRKENSAFR